MGLISCYFMQGGTLSTSFSWGLLGSARITVIIFQRTSLGNGVMGIYLVLFLLPVQTPLLKLMAKDTYSNFDDQAMHLSVCSISLLEGQRILLHKTVRYLFSYLYWRTCTNAHHDFCFHFLFWHQQEKVGVLHHHMISNRWYFMVTVETALPKKRFIVVLL